MLTIITAKTATAINKTFKKITQELLNDFKNS